tara:strand:- start:31 stop:228 length:198 start_codon:yes stop_codon:yes gene_type:complete
MWWGDEIAQFPKNFEAVLRTRHGWVTKERLLDLWRRFYYNTKTDEQNTKTSEGGDGIKIETGKDT